MNRPEQILQQHVATFLRQAVPPPPMGPLWTHAPNGGKRTPAESAIFKSMGVRAGWPDLTFMWAGTDRRPFAIELKADKGALTDHQRVVLADLELAGVRTFVCRSLPEVQAALSEMGVPLKARIAA